MKAGTRSRRKSAPRNSDTCRCGCHLLMGVLIHIVPCCQICGTCREWIRRDRIVQHEEKCQAKR